MKFADPLWLLAGLAGCGLLLWAWWRHDARQRRALATFASPHLHEQLTASFSTTGRNWKRGLFLAATACLFLALARPQAGFRWEEVKRRGIEVIFAVDVSRSMLTPDVKPDRLTRAKLAVDDFVSHLDGDGVGLIAFAGSAFLQCPITLDYDAFHESLAALDTSVIPRGGTDIASAIREAQTALQNRPSTDKILILLTDGEDLEGSALDAAMAAAKTGLKIYAVGVGTANGDLIPLPADQGGGFIKDDAGQFVKSRLDEAELKVLTGATGGLYEPLGAQGQGLDLIYQTALAPLTKHDLASRRQRVYLERFQWPLAAGFLFLLASMSIGTRRRHPRKTVVPPVVPVVPRAPLGASAFAVALGLLLGLSGNRAKASPVSAEAAYLKGDYATAEREYAEAAQTDAKKTELQFNAGTAAYKAGKYPQAASAFQKSLGGEPSGDPRRLAAQEDAYYNLGNTLYRTGQKAVQSKPEETIKTWEQSVKTYDAALQLRATDADAKFNRDFVQKKLDELKKQQQQKQQQQNDQKQKDQNQPDKSGQKPADKNQPDQDKNPARRIKRAAGQGRRTRRTIPVSRKTSRQQAAAPSRTSRSRPRQRARSPGRPAARRQARRRQTNPRTRRPRPTPSANPGR